MSLIKYIKEHLIFGSTFGGGIPVSHVPRFWAYQDFSSITGTNLTITQNENATSSYTPNNSQIVSNSVVITDTNGKSIYTGTTRLFSSRVYASNTNQNVTLNAVPNNIWSPFRIWYLIESSFKPDGRIEAPKFVTKQRLEMLNATYVDQTGDTMYGNLDMNSNQLTNLPSPISNGEPLIYGNADDVYFYDTTRSKILSVSCIATIAGNNNTNVTNQYLKQVDGIYTNINGFLLPNNTTLVCIVASSKIGINATWTAEIRKNGSPTVIDSITITNSDRAYDSTKNTDFNAGDIIEIYMNGTGINSPKVILHLRRRK